MQDHCGNMARLPPPLTVRIVGSSAGDHAHAAVQLVSSLVEAEFGECSTTMWKHGWRCSSSTMTLPSCWRYQRCSSSQRCCALLSPVREMSKAIPVVWTDACSPVVGAALGFQRLSAFCSCTVLTADVRVRDLRACRKKSSARLSACSAAHGRKQAWSPVSFFSLSASDVRIGTSSPDCTISCSSLFVRIRGRRSLSAS